MNSNKTILYDVSLLRGKCSSLIESINEFLAANGKEKIVFPEYQKLCLALLGQYNGGKSTLVNALLGEKRAETGDMPVTRFGKKYDWKDLHVLDLPGRGAREEEEAEAMDALETAHAVLYVVSSKGGLDNESFWSDLEYLKYHNIPFVLVVNDKQPHQDDVAERKYRDKTLIEFKRKADARLDGFDSVFWINAKRAEKGRCPEVKETFVKFSGIIPLENAIVDIFYLNDPILRDMSQLKKAAVVLGSIQEQLSNSIKSDDMKEVSKNLELCNNVQGKLSALAQNLVLEQFGPLKDIVYAKIEQTTLISGEEKKYMQNDLLMLIQAVWTETVNIYEQQLEVELKPLFSLLQGQVFNKSEFEKQIFLQIAPFTAPGTFNAEETDLVASAGKIAAALEVGNQLGKCVLSETAKESSKVVLKEGAKEASKGGAAKALGPLLAVATAAWEIYQGFKQAKKEEQMMKAIMRETEAKASMMTSMLKQMFLGRTSKFVVDSLIPVRQHLQNQLRDKSGQFAQDEAIMLKVSDYISRINSLISEINARCRY